MAGAAVTTGGVLSGSFVIFCIGTTLIGVLNGFGQYYRFAAADVAAQQYRSRAISYVLAGGVIAAFAGPNLANWSRRLLPVEFSGSYASLILVYLLSFTMAAPKAHEDHCDDDRKNNRRADHKLAKGPVGLLSGEHLVALFTSSEPALG